MRALLFTVCFSIRALAQQDAEPVLDSSARAAAIEELAKKLTARYVIPESTLGIVAAVRDAQRTGEYEGGLTVKQFVNKLNTTLLAASHDRHLQVFADPLAAAPASSSAPASRERFNFGLNKLERLRGNVGYLELLSFEPVDRAAESAILGALANFDAIILDLRNNGGGNTPMVAFVASYFFEPTPVHLTDIYWRDSGETSQFWSWPLVPGRRSPRQPLYILTSGSTFSSAEDFAYSLQRLKRATIVGEQSRGGAHSGRGLVRLTPLFTAFIPVGRSLDPVTKSNWDGTGVEPDVRTTADRALAEAHLAALKRLLETETSEQWRQNLRPIIQDISRR